MQPAVVNVSTSNPAQSQSWNTLWDRLHLKEGSHPSLPSGLLSSRRSGWTAKLILHTRPSWKNKKHGGFLLITHYILENRRPHWPGMKCPVPFIQAGAGSSVTLTCSFLIIPKTPQTLKSRHTKIGNCQIWNVPNIQKAFFCGCKRHVIVAE